MTELLSVIGKAVIISFIFGACAYPKMKCFRRTTNWNGRVVERCVCYYKTEDDTVYRTYPGMEYCKEDQ